MEEVEAKLRWDLYIRVAKPIPHTHPTWRIGREASVVINEIIAPIEAQLEEDTKWKK